MHEQSNEVDIGLVIALARRIATQLVGVTIQSITFDRQESGNNIFNVLLTNNNTVTLSIPITDNFSEIFVLASGSTNETDNGNWRVNIDSNGLLSFDRREGSTWVMKQALGDSVRSDIYFATGVAGGMKYEDLNNVTREVIRLSPGGTIWSLGDEEIQASVVSSDDPLVITPTTGAPINVAGNALTNVTETTSNLQFTFMSGEGGRITAVTINTSTGITRARLVITDVDANVVVYETATAFDFTNNNAGVAVPTGEQTITLLRVARIRANVNYQINIFSSTDTTYLGGTVNTQFVPFFNYNLLQVNFNDMTHNGNITDQIESKLVEGANVSITRTGDEITIAATEPGTGTMGINVQDEGTALTGVGQALNFTGEGVTATGSGALKTVNIPGGMQDQQKIEVTSSFTINASNASTYSGNIIFTPGTQVQDITITIAEGLTTLNFFDLVVKGTGAVRLAASGIERINGESDIRFTNLEGGRIIQVEAGTYSLIFDNTDPDMTDDYIDNARLDGSNLILENANTAISDLTVNLSSLIVLTPQTFTATGVQNYGQETRGGLFILASTVTAFDLTIGAPTSDGWFAIANQNTSEIEFDISAVAATFGGANISDPQAYNIEGNTTTLFYTSNNIIYPISSTAIGTSGAMGEHPVVLTRDTPSLTDLNSLAQASLNDNSALWVVASDQIAANESTVDSSIMIRALEAGLLDANGAEISTTAVQKSTVVLSGGSIVRIFSNTDLRVVSAPSPGAMRQLYPDIPFTGAIRLEESDEALYNSYVRRTATNAGGTTNQYIALPDLNPANRPSWVREGDVFAMRHTGTSTGSQRPAIRSDNTGDSIAGQGTIYWVNPGQTVAVQAPRVGIRTWQLFPVSQRSDGRTYYNPEVMLPSQFYIDETDSKALDNSLRLHIKEEIVDGIVRDHILSSSSTNNPVSLIFEKKNDQDSIAWIQWWSTINTNVPPLGTAVEEIKNNIDTALNYIENTISSSYDFELADPSTLISIDYLTHQTGDTIKIGLASALPTHIITLDVITVKNNLFAGNNGDWAITQIYGDRLAIDITIPGSSSANNTAASGFIDRTLYCRTVVKSEAFRQHNFDVYRNSARNNPVTSFLTDWFDITSETMPGNSILNIGYNTDIQATESKLAIQDDSEMFFTVLGGPRGNIHYFDNSGGEYQNTRYLPLNYEDIHVRTSGTCNFYIDLRPADIPAGERRRYSIYSDTANDDDDVNIYIGRAGGTIDSDEGLAVFGIRNGVRQELELYNDGNRNGWRLVSPFSRLMPSAEVTTVAAPASGAISMSIAEIVSTENEDPSFRFMTVSNNKFVLKGNFDYTATMSIRLRFDGNEDMGLSFVNCSIVPTLTRAGSTTDITRATGNTHSPLLFIRNGTSTNDNTKPVITLNAIVRINGQTNDEIGFELRFGTFPSGYTLSDLRQVSKSYTIQVTGGIE